jgi:hypothetical protein
MESSVDIATHFEENTASLSNISENMVVTVAAGIAIEATTIAPGSEGTCAIWNRTAAKAGIRSNLIPDDRYTRQSVKIFVNLAVLMTPPIISIAIGIVISPTALIAAFILLCTGIPVRNMINPI